VQFLSNQIATVKTYAQVLIGLCGLTITVTGFSGAHMIRSGSTVVVLERRNRQRADRCNTDTREEARRLRDLFVDQPAQYVQFLSNQIATVKTYAQVLIGLCGLTITVTGFSGPASRAPT
jgi:hypothetical protein